MLKTDWKTSDIYTASAVNEIASAVNKTVDDIDAVKNSPSSRPTTLNISDLYPTNGTAGTNIYTLGDAVAIVPSQLRRLGLTISFLYQLDANTVIPVSYQFIDVNTGNWTKIKYWSKQPGVVPFEGIDSLIKPELCGEYEVLNMNKCVASLSVTSDFAGHVINQFIKTNLIVTESGVLDGSHNDTAVNMYMRIYNIIGTIPGLDRGKFGKWIRTITELDLLNASGNILRYFGGVLDSCTVETSTYTGNIALADVFYTQQARMPTLPMQSVQSFVGKVGDKYYRQFKNISSYSQTGINLDADKIYIDVNNKLMYVADPNFLYGTIQIGQKERYLTQAQYEALGTYDDGTKYYIIEN